MSVWIWILLLYLVVGLVKAIAHVGSGKKGAKATPAQTFFIVVLLWPLVVFMERR